MGNVIADWGEVKIYDSIPYKIGHTTHDFRYSFRSSRATFYTLESHPQYILKKLNFNKPEFQQGHEILLKAFNRSKKWARIYGLEFDNQFSPFIVYERVEKTKWKDLQEDQKFDLIHQLKVELMRAFDLGWYFYSLTDFNIRIDKGKLILLGWDNLKPIETNKTFEDYYSWSWLI